MEGSPLAWPITIAMIQQSDEFRQASLCECWQSQRVIVVNASIAKYQAK